MSSKILVMMPDSLEVYLAALTATQSMVKAMVFNWRTWNPSIDITIARPIELAYLDAAFTTICKIENTMPIPKRGDWEMICTFDLDKAYDMSVHTKRHMAQVFGLIMGGDPPILPDLSLVKFKEVPKTDILTVMPGFALNEQSEAAASAVEASKMVVGRQCGMTYLAAALGKLVVEISPTDKHRWWLTKFPSTKYAQIHSDNVAPEMLEKAVTELWERHTTVDSTTPTVPSTSDVKLANES